MTDRSATGAARHDRLRVERSGKGEPVTLLHGFTQNANAWGRFKEILSNTHAIHAVDLPGHGGSSRVRADLWETATLVARSGEPSDYIGYSLGARVLLHVALSQPDVVRRAVLIGATGGIEDEEDRAARVAADELLAVKLDGAARDANGLEHFLDDWLAGPLFDGLTEVGASMSARLQNSAADLASSLRLCGTGRQVPLWSRVGELAMPVLVLAGDRDERFKLLGQRLADSIGANATFTVVPASNHACQLERPAETARIIEDFFSCTDR